MPYHPLFDSAAVVLLSIFSLGLSKASISQRSACLVVLSLLTWHCVARCPTYIHRSSWAQSVGGYTLALLLHYVDVGVLNAWSFELQGPVRDFAKGPIARHETARLISEKHSTIDSVTTQKAKDDSILARLKFGLWVFCSWRFVDTPYQVRNIPKLEENLRQNRSAFLIHTGVTIAICYLILDGMLLSQDPQLAAKFFSAEKTALFSRLGSVTPEELFMRFFAALGLGVSLVSVQRGVYCILALICVGLGFNEPEQWPPFNGYLSEACCLRKFWSSFWHQMNTHRLLSVVNFLVYEILRVPHSWKRSYAVRCLGAWLVFFSSGVFHVALDVSAGIPATKSGALAFFLIQPVGIMMEDLFKSALAPLQERLQISEGINRCIGALWVLLWMTWTVPWYMYPIVAQGSGDDGVIPVSIILYMKSLLS